MDPALAGSPSNAVRLHPPAARVPASRTPFAGTSTIAPVNDNEAYAPILPASAISASRVLLPPNAAPLPPPILVTATSSPAKRAAALGNNSTLIRGIRPTPFPVGASLVLHNKENVASDLTTCSVASCSSTANAANSENPFRPPARRLLDSSRLRIRPQQPPKTKKAAPAEPVRTPLASTSDNTTVKVGRVKNSNNLSRSSSSEIAVSKPAKSSVISESGPESVGTGQPKLNPAARPTKLKPPGSRLPGDATLLRPLNRSASGSRRPDSFIPSRISRPRQVSGPQFCTSSQNRPIKVSAPRRSASRPSTHRASIGPRLSSAVANTSPLTTSSAQKLRRSMEVSEAATLRAAAKAQREAMAKEMESDDHVIEEVAEMPDSADEGEEGTGEDKQEAEDRKQDQLQKPQEMQHFQEDDREHGTAAEAEELQMNALGDDGTALASSAPQTQEEDDAEETEGIVTSAVTDSQPTNAPSELNSSVPADHVDDAAIDPFEALLQEVHALIAAGPSSATGSNDDPVPPQLPEEALSIPQAQAPQQTLAQKAGQQQHAQRLEPDQKQDTQLQPEQQAQHEVIHPVLVRGYVESQAHQATNSDVAVEAQPQQSEKPSIHTPVAPLNASQEPSSVLKPTPLFDQAQSVVSAPSCSSSTGPVHVAPPTAAVATVPAPAPAPTPVLTSVTLPATATAPARPVAPKPSHGTRSSALPRRRQVSHLPLPVGTKTLPHQPTSPSRASALSSSSREAASSRTHLTQITPAMSQAGHVSVQQQQLLQNKIYPPSFTQMSVKELSRLTALHTRSNEVQMVRIKLDTVRLRGRRRPPSPTSRIRRLGQDDGFGEDQDWEEDDDAEDDGDGDADLVTEPEHPIASPLPATIHRNTSTRVLRSSSSTSPRTISGSKQQQLRVGEGSSRKRVRWEDDGVRRGAGASGAPMKSNKKPRRWAPPRYRMGGLTSATRSNVEATLSNGSALMPRTPTGKGPGVILCGKSCLTPKLRTLQLDALGNSMDTERPLDLHAQLKKTKVVVKRYIYDGEDEDELGGERIEEEDAHRLSAGAPMVGAGGPVARAGRGAVAIAGAISLGFHSGPGEGGLLLIPALGGSRSRGGPPHTAAVAAGRYR